MNPYRKDRGPAAADEGAAARRASYRGARRRLLVAGGALLGLGAAMPFLGRACHSTLPPLDVPDSLLRAGATFPRPEAELRPAAPLEPLLAADAPAGLAVVEPTANALNLRPGEPVVVRFNRPMVEASAVGKAAARSPLVLTPSVRGKATWTARNTVSFAAEAAAWGGGRTATLALSPELRSLAGESPPEFVPRTIVFDDGPRFAHAPRASRILPGEPLTLLFSGRVRAAELPSQVLVYEVDGGRRMLPFSTSERARDKAGLVPVELRLRRALEPGAHLAVALAPPIAWGGSSPRVVGFEVAPRPHIEGIACPESATEASACDHQGPPGKILDIGEALRLLSSEPLGALGEGALEVRPALAGMRVKVEDRKRLALTGDWDPGQVYEVRVGALRDVEGRPLAKMPSLAVRSAGRTPQVRARSGRLSFEQDAAAALGIEAIHVEAGEARVAAVPRGAEMEAALFPERFLGAERAGSWRGIPLHDLVPESRPNRWGRGALAWRTHAAGEEMAVISLLPAGAPPATEKLPASFVQRTDLGIDAQVLPRGVLLWVTSVSGAKPVAGAQITVAGADGKASMAAVTDARGLSWVPMPEALLADGGAVRAVHGQDRAVLVVDPRTAMGPRHLGTTPGEAPPGPGAWVAAVFTDRGIARPGETIHAKAVVRTGAAGALSAPAGGVVELALFAPSGKAPIAERSAKVSAFGTVDADFPIAPGAEPGAYRVEVKRPAQEQPAGAATFTVGDYRPPTFRVDLTAASAALVDRDALRVGVRASHLFGPPAAGMPARWTLIREGAAAYPARLHEYAFGPVDGSTHGGTIASGEVTLDAEGHADVEAAVAVGGPLRQDAVFEVTVRDVSGLATAARKRIELRPAELEVGLRRDKDWQEHDADLNLDALVIGADGAPVTGRKVEARVVREGWKTYWESRHQRHGGEDEEEGEEQPYQARRAQQREVVHRCTLTSEKDPVRCSWKPKRAGSYLLEAQTRDERGRVSVASRRVYVAGPDEHPDRDPAGTAISLTPAKRAVEVGETAEIAFECPFTEAHALLTVERDGVLHTEVRPVSGGGVVLRFPVTAAMVPNAFVSLSLVRPRTGPPGEKLDLRAPDLRVGMAELSVRPAASPLTVTVEASASAPAGSEVPVAVHVRDAAGQGVAAEVALYAVDEGTLRVTGYALPDPLSGVYRRLPAAFAWEDLRRGLVSRLGEPLSPSAGGDGGHSAGRKLPEQERFEPTPLWLPRLTTDAAGEATATLRLPARATQYRIMAVAVDRGTRAGRAERTVIAAMPLVVRPVLPAAVTAGDRFLAAAFVHNTEDTAAEVTVTPVVNGAARPAQTIQMAAHAEARVGEWIEAPRGESIAVRFEARGAAGAGAQAGGRILVSPRGHGVRSEVAGAVIGTRELTISLPPEAEAPGSVMLSVAGHPFVGFDASLDALLTAPEGGVEGAASTVLGLAAYASLDRTKRPGSLGPEELAARARAAVAKLAAMQTRGGGFGDWGPSSSPDAYLSAYALHALVVAGKAGFAAPDDAVERARSYVHGEARDTTFLDRGVGGHDDLALALRALAEAHEPDADRTTALYEQRERLTPYGLAQLALAMDPLDRRRDTLVLDALRRALPTRADEKRDARVLRWYDGSARTLGAVLEAAVAIPVGHRDAGRVATRLLALRGESTWWSTHESAHALTAVAAYAASVRTEAPLAPEIFLDGAPLAAAERTDAMSWYTLPVARVAGGAHKLRLTVRGAAWFTLSARWTVPLGPADALARGEEAALHRVLEDAHGKVLGDGAHVRLGDLVRVRLFFHSEHVSPPYVAIRDRLAGGLEAVDAAHETTPRASLWALLGMGPDDDVVDSRGHWAARSLEVIAHRAFTPGHAAFYQSKPSSGLRELTYGARAVAVGTFVVPPAEVEALYAAGFAARSTAITLTVDP